MKNTALIVLGIVILVALIGFVVHFKDEAKKVSKNLEVERYSRLVAEEKVVNTASKIRQLENDLKVSEDRMTKVQSVLKEQRTVNNDLEEQFQRISKAKSELEVKLQEAINQPEVVAVQAAEPQSAQTNETVPVSN